MGAFVGILEAAPAAHVIDENDLEIGYAGLDVFKESDEGRSVDKAQPAPGHVAVGAHYFDAAATA
jgi:hypothetical protein